VVINDPNSKAYLTNPLNWSNVDIYLHIFLTFFFGHFASMLFFDGILRNISNLFFFHYPAIYIVHILFSIAYLAFTVWFLTICWRWWRNRSLLPMTHNQSYSTTSQQQTLIAQSYVFFAAIMLIIGFFIYIVIGVIDLSIRTRYSKTFYGDVFVFVFRCILWLLAIGAILCLNRDYLAKGFLAKKKKTNQAMKS
jgi:hypothetical protein